jgi:hypothetical protein
MSLEVLHDRLGGPVFRIQTTDRTQILPNCVAVGVPVLVPQGPRKRHGSRIRHARPGAVIGAVPRTLKRSAGLIQVDWLGGEYGAEPAGESPRCGVDPIASANCWTFVLLLIAVVGRPWTPNSAERIIVTPTQ